MIAKIWTYIWSIPSSIRMYISSIFSGTADLFWFHAVLIAGSVIAGITVGAGIIFEGKNYSERTHRIAVWLVIVGVAVRSFCTIVLFVGDEALSGAQQDKIITLETKIAPRNLSIEQMQAIANAIQPFNGMHFDLSVTQEIEPLRLLDKVEDAITLGGWIEQLDKSPVSHFDRMNKSMVGIRTVLGVWVLYPQKSGPEFERAAKALRDALDKQNLTGSFLAISGDEPYNLDAIHVWVGGKP